ncbi:hypothetical protein V2J09_000196 [Rumex salicifolius]
MWQVLSLPSNFTALPSVTCRARPPGKSKAPKINRRENANGDSAAEFGVGIIGTGKVKKEPLWQCVKGCGACCKLNKGPEFASPEEIFDNAEDIELYKSMTGSDGWCIHYDKNMRTCSIYNDRPYFCRVQPDIFQMLYGVKERNFDKVACSACKETISSVYGVSSKELQHFNQAMPYLSSNLCTQTFSYDPAFYSSGEDNDTYPESVSDEIFCGSELPSLREDDFDLEREDYQFIGDELSYNRDEEAISKNDYGVRTDCSASEAPAIATNCYAMVLSMLILGMISYTATLQMMDLLNGQLSSGPPEIRNRMNEMR